MNAGATPSSRFDTETTADGLVKAGPQRDLLSMESLLSRLTMLIQTCEGCENVTVIGADRLLIPDSRDGCNCSISLVLDPAGVAPEVYALGYAQVIVTARQSWNLEEEGAGSGAAVPDFEL